MPRVRISCRKYLHYSWKSTICGFSVSSFRKPTKSAQKIKKPSTWTTQNLILIHWLQVSCSPGKWTKTRPGKQQNNNEKPCAWILPVLQCLQNPTLVYHSSRENFREKSKIQKVKKFSTFRFFSFFRLFEQKSPGMGTFRLFDFSRSKIVIFTVWPLPARRAHSQLGNHQICIVTPEKIDFSNLLYFWGGMYYFLCFGCNRVYGCIHKWGRAPNCQKIVSKPLVFWVPHCQWEKALQLRLECK